MKKDSTASTRKSLKPTLHALYVNNEPVSRMSAVEEAVIVTLFHDTLARAARGHYHPGYKSGDKIRIVSGTKTVKEDTLK